MDGRGKGCGAERRGPSAGRTHPERRASVLDRPRPQPQRQRRHPARAFTPREPAGPEREGIGNVHSRRKVPEAAS